MSRNLTLGILQFNASRDKYVNIEKIMKFIKVNSANLVIIPEYSMANITGLSPYKVYEIAEDINGDYVSKLSKIAIENSLYMVLTLFERTNKPPKIYNTAILISPNGDIVDIYRKIHLFDAYGYRESNYMEAGSRPSQVIDIGRAKIALSICFDIRFPELYRIYALNGAELVVIPSAWYKGPLKEETLSFLARSRAHENTIYIAIANQYSQDFTGRSMVIDPLGTVLIDLGIGEKYVEYTIDIDYVHEIRKILPVLKLRKPDIYHKYLCEKTKRNT